MRVSGRSFRAGMETCRVWGTQGSEGSQLLHSVCLHHLHFAHPEPYTPQQQELNKIVVPFSGLDNFRERGKRTFRQSK